MFPYSLLPPPSVSKTALNEEARSGNSSSCEDVWDSSWLIVRFESKKKEQGTVTDVAGVLGLGLSCVLVENLTGPSLDVQAAHSVHEELSVIGFGHSVPA